MRRKGERRRKRRRKGNLRKRHSIWISNVYARGEAARLLLPLVLRTTVILPRLSSRPLITANKAQNTRQNPESNIVVHSGSA
jgi:hypothetical protein